MSTGYVVIMANEPTRPLGGTTMENIIIKGQTTVEEAIKGNGVLMVGKFKNKNQVLREQAIKSNGVIMAGRLPNKREIMEATNDSVIDMPEIIAEDKVEIPQFLLKAQEERKATQRQANKKKASPKKPSLKALIVSTLKTL